MLLEDGKEPKKRVWASFYVVLAGPTLYFFKDEREKKKGKRPVAVTAVDNKAVTVISEAGRRGHVLMLSSLTERLVLHAAEEEVMRKFLQVLVPGFQPQVSGAALAPDDGLQRRNSVSPTTPRSPTMSRATPSTVAEEDERAPKKEGGFVKYLNKYLRSRPAKEELKQKGIIQDTVFGGTVVEQVEKEKRAGSTVVAGVPLIVVKCVPEVEKHLHEQGIYRVSGNASLIQRLVVATNADVTKLDLGEVEDVHAVTGLLKLYFRELSEPIFLDHMYPEFIAAAKMSDRAEKLKEIQRLLRLLPGEHRQTLRFLFDHLTKVAAQGDVNKMQINNLGIVFGPTLLRRIEPTPESIIMDSPFQSGIVEELLREPSLLASD